MFPLDGKHVLCFKLTDSQTKTLSMAEIVTPPPRNAVARPVSEALLNEKARSSSRATRFFANLLLTSGIAAYRIFW